MSENLVLCFLTTSLMIIHHKTKETFFRIKRILSEKMTGLLYYYQ